MSILIKGMTIPRSCDECQFSVDEGRFCVAAQKIIPIVGSVGWCPLIEIPPHGRLIDADALTGKAYMDGKLMCVEMDDIEEAPTIIEAEGRE